MEDWEYRYLHCDYVRKYTDEEPAITVCRLLCE